MSRGSQSIRVLYVVPSSFTLHYHMKGQLKFLAECGFEVEVAGDPDSRSAAAAKREGVAYHPVAIRQRPAPVQDVRAMVQLVRLMRRGRFDLVNCCTKKGGLLGAIVARMTGTRRVVYVVRGVTAGHASVAEQRLFPWIERTISWLSDRVVVISESNRALFLERKLCPVGKLVVIGAGSVNGVDAAAFSRTDEVLRKGTALRAASGIPGRDYVFGYVGRLSLQKGLSELADAWRSVRDTQPDVRLLIVSPPEVEAGAAGVVTGLRADPRVHMVGFMPDPAVAYAAMDCLVLPSHGEGFGIVVLEAGAMELPVIATAVSGCVDAVVQEETGILVEPRDAGALYRAMQRVLLEPEQARVWGQNARRRCLTLFRQEVIWRGYADLYRRLLSAC